MKTSQTANLPIAPPEYYRDNEQTMRRTLEQHLNTMRDDIQNNELKKDKNSSLAIRRFQFLLMGG